MTNNQPEVRIDPTAMQEFAVRCLMATGVSAPDALTIASNLVDAERRGLRSHGVSRLLEVYCQRLRRHATNPRPNIREITRFGSVALLDGDGGPGQVAATRGMQTAIELANTHGIGAVGTRNSSHFGMGATYVEQAAAAQCIGMAFSSAPSNMPPWGGSARFFGTNPISFAVPYKDADPIVIDMSTSVTARGRIVLAAQQGETIPEGWAIDQHGAPTTDANEALKGAVLPFGGHKGSGLAFMVEVLSSLLTGALVTNQIVDLYDTGTSHQGLGHFFIAIDVRRFMDVEEMDARMQDLVAGVKSQPRMQGVDEILLPGEREFRSRHLADVDGLVVPIAVVQSLIQLANELDVHPIEFMSD